MKRSKIFLLTALLSVVGLSASGQGYEDDLYSAPRRESSTERAARRGMQEQRRQQNRYNSYTYNEPQVYNELVTSYAEALARRIDANNDTEDRSDSFYRMMDEYRDILIRKYDPNLYNVIQFNNMMWVEPQDITALFDGSDPAQGVQRYSSAKRVKQSQSSGSKSNVQFNLVVAPGAWGGYWGFSPYGGWNVSLGFGWGSYWGRPGWGPYCPGGGWWDPWYDPYWNPSPWWGPYPPYWGGGHWRPYPHPSPYPVRNRPVVHYGGSSRPGYGHNSPAGSIRPGGGTSSGRPVYRPGSSGMNVVDYNTRPGSSGGSSVRPGGGESNYRPSVGTGGSSVRPSQGATQSVSRPSREQWQQQQQQQQQQQNQSRPTNRPSTERPSYNRPSYNPPSGGGGGSVRPSGGGGSQSSGGGGGFSTGRPR